VIFTVVGRVGVGARIGVRNGHAIGTEAGQQDLGNTARRSRLPHRKSRREDRSKGNKIPSEFYWEFYREFSCEVHQRCAVTSTASADEHTISLLEACPAVASGHIARAQPFPGPRRPIPPGPGARGSERRSLASISTRRTIFESLPRPCRSGTFHGWRVKVSRTRRPSTYLAMSPSLVHLEGSPPSVVISNSGQSPMLLHYTREIVPSMMYCGSVPSRRASHHSADPTNAGWLSAPPESPIGRPQIRTTSPSPSRHHTRAPDSAVLAGHELAPPTLTKGQQMIWSWPVLTLVDGN
jgi:hypothetical protein